MVKPTINTFEQIAPLIIQSYERYLPTAFDDSLTMIEKVNKIIQYCNQIGQLTNDVVAQWNTVMDWVMNEGLTTDVNNKLDAMASDGTLANLINNVLFDELNSRIDDLSINVKKYGAKGDGVTNDTIAIQSAIDTGRNVYFPAGNYIVSDTLYIKNHGQILKGENQSTAKITMNVTGKDLIVNNAQNYFIGIRDLSLVGQNDHVAVNLGVSPQCSIKNVTMDKFSIGLMVNSWVASFENLQASNMSTGFRVLGGTSQTWKNCYAKNVTYGFSIGDVVNDSGLGVQVLTYSSFLSCAVDDATQYAYYIRGGMSSTEFISCGCELPRMGMFYFGSENNAQGVPTKYNSATIRTPRAILSDDSYTASCFLKNDGANTIDIFGLDSQSISGNYSKLIESIGLNNQNYVTIHNSDFVFPTQSQSDVFSFEKSSSWGVNSIKNQSLPFLSPRNFKINSGSQVHKTTGDLDVRFLIPNDGDICFGNIELYPLSGGNDTPVGKILFYGKNNAGTVEGSFNSLGTSFTIDSNHQSNVGGQTSFRLGVTLTQPYLIFAEMYTDQNSIDYQRIAWI
jgi:hypothetical protein